MLANKWVKRGLVVASLFALLLYVLEIDAFARAGGSRSSGSRGSRSYSSPSTPSKSATAPQRQVAPSPAPGMSQPQSGGFMRNMMGGIAGGLIGGMIGRNAIQEHGLCRRRRGIRRRYRAVRNYPDRCDPLWNLVVHQEKAAGSNGNGWSGNLPGGVAITAGADLWIDAGRRL